MTIVSSLMQTSLEQGEGKEAKRRKEDGENAVTVSKTSNSHGSDTKVKVKGEVRSVLSSRDGRNALCEDRSRNIMFQYRGISF